MQAAALRKAESARFLTAGGASEGRGLTSALMAQVRERFGTEGTDRMTLRRILRTVAGGDPVNFAPAVLPSYTRAGKPPAEASPETWACFLTTIRDAGPQFPFKQAWRRISRRASGLVVLDQQVVAALQPRHSAALNRLILAYTSKSRKWLAGIKPNETRSQT